MERSANNMSIIRSLNEQLNKTSYTEVIDALIKDEEEAIDGYEKAKIDLLHSGISSDEYDEAFKVFEHIIAEEEEHIEELKELLK